MARLSAYSKQFIRILIVFEAILGISNYEGEFCCFPFQN